MARSWPGHRTVRLWRSSTRPNLKIRSAFCSSTLRLASAAADVSTVQIRRDSSPAFSADGKSLAFIRTISLSVQDIYLVSIHGGEPRRLTRDGRRIFGLAWNPADGRIVFTSVRGGSARLFRLGAQAVSRSGSAALAKTPPSSPSAGREAAWPTRARPGHQHLALPHPRGRSPGPAPVRLISSTRRNRARSIPRRRAHRLRLEPLRQYGNLAQRQEWRGGDAVDHMEGAPRVARAGRPTAARLPSIPGRRQSDIYVISSEGGIPRRLTSESSAEVVPSFSRDGRFIYFASNRTGAYQVWKAPATGGAAVQITRGGGFHAIESPDGQFLYYAKSPSDPGLWRVPLSGGNEEPVLETLARAIGAIGPLPKPASISCGARKPPPASASRSTSST